MLNLGGIDNRPPKADQSVGRFRVARNVMPTPDNRLIPRYDNSIYSSFAADSTVTTFNTIPYNNDVLSLCAKYSADSGIQYTPVLNGVDSIPSAVEAICSTIQNNDVVYGQAVMAYRRNNTVFYKVQEQVETSLDLLKYDGVELRKAGCDQPIISTAGFNATGTRYVRAIQHSIDFDNNQPASEYVQFRTNDTNLSVTLDRSSGNLISNNAGQTGFSPTSVISNDSIPESYFVGTATYDAGNLDFPITTTKTNITTANKIGSYVIVKESQYVIGGIYYLGVALKIKQVTPSIKLDANDVYVLDFNREWQKINISGLDASNLASSISWGTKTFMSFWESLSASGIYYFRKLSPSFPDALAVTFATTVTLTAAATATAGSDTKIITLAPILNDIYDVNTKKLSPNSRANFGSSTQSDFYCLTVYQDQMLLANDDLIFFSDFTLGGEFEQLNSSNFIKVGDLDFGRVTSICATQDFFVVSRERKNYYVNGNIATGNYRVQDIVEAEIGAWSNNSSILIKDSVVLITALGVFQIVGGGRAELISKTCPKNFSTYDANSVNEDVVFRLLGFNSELLPEQDPESYLDDGLSVAYDEYRELLVILKKGVNQSNVAIVLHTATGEFYEWDGIKSGQFIESIGFVKAKMYIGTTDLTAPNNAVIYKEDAAATLSYCTSNPIILYSSWMTAGEPSLEKSLLQLKMFGRVQSNGITSGLKVKSFKDWDFNTATTDSTYYPNSPSLSLDSQTQYSHKKRLNSDKVLAASVGFSVNTTGVTFEIESMEIEFNAIQEGMKK
jgi:hypothetical protein